MTIIEYYYYEELVREILIEAHASEPRPDRTGTGTIGTFGATLRYNLQDGFPLIASKKTSLDIAVKELLWFLSGDTNARTLQEQGVHIWDEWADAAGDLGPIYGAQWRNWIAPDGRHIDQMQRLVDGIRRDPHSRRHIVTAWNPGEIDDMALPPCHAFMQFRVEGNRLSCLMYQRSADLFLGVPYNLAEYALLTHLVARETGYVAGDLVWVGGDVHLYQNHIEQARLMVQRPYRPLPKLVIDTGARRTDLFSYRRSDFRVEGYDPHPAIKAPVAV